MYKNYTRNEDSPVTIIMPLSPGYTEKCKKLHL